MRELTKHENELLAFMLEAADPRWHGLRTSLLSCRVEDMKDGGMGSIRFMMPSCGNRKLGGAIAAAKFLDSDGIEVSLVLNVDERGELFELDIWKTDFSRLLNYPTVDQLELQALDISSKE